MNFDKEDEITWDELSPSLQVVKEAVINYEIHNYKRVCVL